jgi:hypothetical protein
VSERSVHAAACVADVVSIGGEGRRERGVLEDPDADCAIRSLIYRSQEEKRC